MVIMVAEMAIVLRLIVILSVSYLRLAKKCWLILRKKLLERRN